MIKNEDTVNKIGRLIDSLKYHCPENVLNTVLLNANMTEHDLSVLTSEVDDSRFNDIEYDDVIKFIDDMALQDESVFRDVLHYIICCYDRDELKLELNEMIKDKYGDLTLIDLCKFSDLSPSAQKEAIYDYIEHYEKNHNYTLEWSEAREHLLDNEEYIYDEHGHNVTKDN